MAEDRPTPPVIPRIPRAREWLHDGTEVPRSDHDLLVMIANRQIDTDTSVGRMLGELGTLRADLNRVMGQTRELEHSRPDIDEVKETVASINADAELASWRNRAKWWRGVSAAVVATVVAAGACGMLARLFWVATVGHP